MKRINKTIGYMLSAISILTGVLIFGVGIYHLVGCFSDSFFYLVAGIFLVMIGISNISDIKENRERR